VESLSIWRPVRFAINLPIFGEFADPKVLGGLARDAENAGWDGCFIWDHIQVDRSQPVTDPWIALAAIALMTNRIRIGPMVTPLYRRHPWKLARETVSLDHLSGERLILGVGLGSDMFGEITTFDGPIDDRIRAAVLDEGLAILIGLWSGKAFTFSGRHYRITETTFLPTPIQSPRIPIWVAGTWPRKPPFRRAARYDGVIAVAGNLNSSLSPEGVIEMVSYIRRFRVTEAAFDVIHSGETTGTDRELDRHRIDAYQLAGITWWLESIFPRFPTVVSARGRILKGPPVS
jgi:alkanesulfonate monooxygenase SsuD/methylene tetrahydromethanopterin reductase-like flavin-dependent oxidoreductase (luciferase family)